MDFCSKAGYKHLSKTLGKQLLGRDSPATSNEDKTKKTNEEKFRTIIEKNTFYFFDKEFAESYEVYLITLKESLLLLKNEIETNGLRKTTFVNFLNEKDYGLDALLALTGFSTESLKRVIYSPTH
jgi:hypothetical protein